MDRGMNRQRTHWRENATQKPHLQFSPPPPWLTTMAENQAKSTPARVLFLFTFLMAGMAAALWRDHQAAATVESIDYPTALGDEQYCPVALLQAGQQFPATLDKSDHPTTMTITSKAALSKREDRLWKAGIATTDGFYLYQSDQPDDPGWYVKSASGLFYKATQSAAP
jgi:hypothetical protein